MFKHLYNILNTTMPRLNLFFLFFLLILTGSCGDQKKPADNEAKKNSTAQNQQKEESLKTIIFFGNSLTAGYGVEPSEAFPAIIQEKIDSLKLSYKVVNAGLSGGVFWLLFFPEEKK